MVKYSFFVLLYFLCINWIYAQEILEINDSIDGIEIGFLLPESFPIYQFDQHEGSIQAIVSELSKSMNCPYMNCDSIFGSIFIQFTVSDSKEISNITILRGLDAAIDKEAIRVIQLLECIAPAMFRDRKMTYKENIRLDFNNI